MPWRLILFAVFLVLLVIFVGVNLSNTCAVSLIFVTYQDVPVYISILVAFALGMLIMIPFTFGKRPSGRERPAPVPPSAQAKPAKPAQKKEEPVARPVNDD